MKKRLGLIVYGILSVLESCINLILYLTFLDKVFSVVDISVPFWVKYCNQVLKSDFLKELKKNNGQDL